MYTALFAFCLPTILKIYIIFALLEINNYIF